MGGYRRVGGSRQRVGKRSKPPRGPYRDPDATFEPVPQGRERPLPPCATKLLTRYYKVFAFWEAYYDSGDAKWAGSITLGLGSSQSAALVEEIEDSGSAWGWFADKAMAMIESGEAPHGRETSKSPEADRYYLALLGGPYGAAKADYEMHSCAKLSAERIQDPARREAMYYIIRQKSCDWYRSIVSTGSQE